MPSSHILQFIGGLVFFFYGLFIIHQGLQFFAGDRLKNMIARTTEGPVKSLFTGILVTFFFQSSSAVTVMTASLAGSGLITLEEAMAVALGAGIGTTFVVLLIAVKSIISSGIILIAIGVAFRVFGARQVVRLTGDVLIGFGMVFFGMLVMAEASTPLKHYEWMPLVFEFMEKHLVVSFLFSALVTALVHSSGVVLGIVISLAYAGSITFEASMPLILGANIGTCFTAIITTLGAPTEAKRAAWANLLLRVGAVLLIVPVYSYYLKFTVWFNELILVHMLELEATVHAGIGLSHFLFNVLVALIFLPFLPLGKKCVCWLIPSRNEVEPFGPKYLDKNALSTPTLAFAQATREVIRMGEIVQQMFRESLSLFERYDPDRVSDIEQRDHQVDTLYKATKFYLARLSVGALKEEEADTELYLITAANELESIGDTIDRHILRLAHKKWNKGVKFSDEGWKELGELHQGVLSMLDLALASFSTSSEELARKMIHHQSFYNDREDQLKISHLMRLNQGLQESIDTSAIHLELLSLFHRINLSLLTMVNHLLPEKIRVPGGLE